MKRSSVVIEIYPFSLIITHALLRCEKEITIDKRSTITLRQLKQNICQSLGWGPLHHYTISILPTYAKQEQLFTEGTSLAELQLPDRSKLIFRYNDAASITESNTNNNNQHDNTRLLEQEINALLESNKQIEEERNNLSTMLKISREELNRLKIQYERLNGERMNELPMKEIEQIYNLQQAALAKTSLAILYKVFSPDIYVYIYINSIQPIYRYATLM